MKRLQLIDNSGRWVRFTNFEDLTINPSLLVLAEPPLATSDGNSAYWNGRLRSWEYRPTPTNNNAQSPIPVLFELPNKFLTINQPAQGSLRKYSETFEKSRLVEIPKWARNGRSRVIVSAASAGSGTYASYSNASVTANSGAYVSRIPLRITKDVTHVLVQVGLGGLYNRNGSTLIRGGSTQIQVGKETLILNDGAGSVPTVSYNGFNLPVYPRNDGSVASATNNTTVFPKEFSGFYYTSTNRPLAGNSAELMYGFAGQNNGNGSNGYVHLEFEEVR